MLVSSTRLIFVCAAFWAASVFAATPAHISGRVLDKSGLVIQRASITLRQSAGASLISTESDAQGNYGFAGVPAGEYLVSASAPGLSLLQPVSLSLADGESKSLDLVLSVTAQRATVEVTSAGVPESVDELSKALDIISLQDAQQRGLFSLSDAVRFSPGLRVSTLGGPAAFTEIETRGLPVQDTAVLFDGAPFRDPTSPKDEASAFENQLMIVDSSRIEVLRGSGSSLYGTNSVAGTLNVITDEGGGPLHGDVDVQGGGLGLFQGSARIAGGLDHNRLGYSIGAGHLNETEGVDDVTPARIWSGQAGVSYAITPTIRAGADLYGTTSFVQSTITPWSLSTGTGIIDAVPNSTFAPSVGDPDQAVYSNFLSALFHFDQQLTPALSYSVRYSLVTTDRNNTDGPAGPITPSYFPPAGNTSDEYFGRVDTLVAKLNYLAGRHDIITAGYEFDREHYREVSVSTTDAQQRFQSGFAQNEARLFGNRLQILVSGRITGVDLDQPVFGGAASPYAGIALPTVSKEYTGDASISYLFPHTGTKLRAHTGNAFRLPSLYERFGSYFYGGYLYALGDPRLSPERAISADGGIDQYLFHEKLRLSGTFFYTHLQQVVGFELFPPDYVDPYGRSDGYSNTGGGYSRGVEVSGELHPNRRTSILASYTHTNAKDVVSEFYTGTGVDPLQMPRVIPNEVKIVASQQIGNRITLAMDFYGGDSYLFPLFGADYTASTAYLFPGPKQLGLSAGYTFPVSEAKSLRFYTRVSNALGQDYYEEGFRTPGRWAVAGIHFAF